MNVGRRLLLAGAAAGLGGMGPDPPGQLRGIPAVAQTIEARVGGRLGVAVLDVYGGARAGWRQDELFPLASTWKLLVVGAVLARADAGTDRLDRRVRYGTSDLVAYSPATEAAAGKQGLTVAELCRAAIVDSDNTAANLLLRTVGGPVGLTVWLRSIGDRVSRVDRDEPSINTIRPGDGRDTTSPAAMLATLRRLTAQDGVLGVTNRDRLLDWLRASRTGAARLRAGLPRFWTGGDKTGTAEDGTSNDVALFWPPNQDPPILVAAFLTGSPSDGPARDAALAELGAAVAASVLR